MTMVSGRKGLCGMGVNANKDVVLLITGCISPAKDITLLALTDASERYQQYIKSIKYYILNTRIKRIVFCDNSNYPPDKSLVDFAKEQNKELEWLSFLGNVRMVQERGKGYGEAEIVKYALENSKLIKPNDYMIKVTGRLVVKNIEILLGLSKRKLCIRPCAVRNGSFYINTQIHMMKVEEYSKSFKGIEKLINDSQGIYLEHAFAICIRNNNLKYKKFIVAPWIEGTSGSTGREYKPGWRSYIKDCIKLYFYKEEK